MTKISKESLLEYGFIEMPEGSTARIVGMYLLKSLAEEDNEKWKTGELDEEESFFGLAYMQTDYGQGLALYMPGSHVVGLLFDSIEQIEQFEKHICFYQDPYAEISF